jgi:manganese oxidase
MEQMSGRMKFVLLFIIGSIIVMFADGLFFDNYNTRPSMAMMHHEMRPPMVPDPAPPSQEEFFAQYNLYPDLPSDPDEPMEPQIIDEGGTKIKVYHIVTNNVLHEIRPGVKVPMISFNNQVPAPTIRVSEGDHVRVILYNNATDPHTIHWHGIENVSTEDDGVPDVGQDWVMPGQSYTYDWIAEPAGTRMYHCHVEAPHHITMGMYGALIVDPKEPEQQADAENIFIFSEYDTSHKHVPLPGEMMAMGPDGNVLPWLNPGPKFMMAFDPQYNEFLVNGKAFPATKIITVKDGQMVRWRLINLGQSVKSIHIHGHHFTVTHRDGFKLPAPFEADTLSLNPGERYDAWFKADNPGIWMIHDHAGMNIMANGYDPGGVMWVLAYEGQNSEVLDAFMKRAAVYSETIEHADEDHGMLTPSGAGGMMEMDMGMGGMGEH